MTDHEPRLFTDDAAIRRIGSKLLDHSLPREEWTHEAHLAATLWIVRDRPDIDAHTDMRAIISTYNHAVGGVNDDTQGYHETITRCYVAAIVDHLAGRTAGQPLVDDVNSLLLSPRGRRDWPLRCYSPEHLFSTAARRGFVPPDLT